MTHPVPGEYQQTESTILVRYFASARAAAEVDEEPLTVPAGASVDDVAAELARRHPGGGLARVLTACGFLLDGVAVRDRSARVGDGAELDVLPPFAGG